MATDYLVVADLLACVPRARLVQYFDDAGLGVLADDDPNLVLVMKQAESAAASRMLRSLPRPSITLLAQNDDIFRNHVAWIACELASERRVEFTNAEGQGAHWTQYERALKEIDLLSKANTRSVGEQAAGPLANSGGNTDTRTVPVGTPTFAIAPSRQSTFGPNGGQGGF